MPAGDVGDVLVLLGGPVVEVEVGAGAWVAVPVDGLVTPVTDASPEVPIVEMPGGPGAPLPVREGDDAPLADGRNVIASFRQEGADDPPDMAPVAP